MITKIPFSLQNEVCMKYLRIILHNIVLQVMPLAEMKIGVQICFVGIRNDFFLYSHQSFSSTSLLSSNLFNGYTASVIIWLCDEVLKVILVIIYCVEKRFLQSLALAMTTGLDFVMFFCRKLKQTPTIGHSPWSACVRQCHVLSSLSGIWKLRLMISNGS